VDVPTANKEACNVQLEKGGLTLSDAMLPSTVKNEINVPAAPME